MVSLSVPRHHGKSTFCLLYAAFVRTSASIKLRIAVRAEEAKIPRSIVCVVSVDMIQDWFQRLVVPNERVYVIKTLWVVAAFKERRLLLITPSHVVPPDGGPRGTLQAIVEHVARRIAIR
jgi:hypothetical protein